MAAFMCKKDWSERKKKEPILAGLKACFKISIVNDTNGL